jgi:hypothetical protein
MRELAKGQNFSHTAVHELFTKPTNARKLPVLLVVVGKLASLAPRVDVEEMLDKFDRLWEATTDQPMTEDQIGAIVKKRGDFAASRPEWRNGEEYKAARERFFTDLNRVLEPKKKTTSLRRWGAQAGVAHRTIRTVLTGERIPIDATLWFILKAADVPDSDIERLRAEASRLRGGHDARAQ